MSLFAELRRRNVIRVAAAYLVASWLLIEATSVLIDIYEAPGWVPKLMVGLLALGFPITLFFSWAFEITPEGVKREAEVDRAGSISHETGRKLDLITIGMLVLVIALVGVERFVLAPPSTTQAVATTSGSIAVLPFVNMSGDAENEYFSDGISEEILNVLAGIPELQVAARTSSFQFKGQDQDIPLIAQQLGVATVLEGSVRKQGERVRITAQLIAADSGFHLWSETYDRDLTDIFAIQDEIAAAIARALEVHLDVQSATGYGTEDLAAYDRYLRGMHLWRLRTEASLLEAIDSFQSAIDADPEFARAYVGMAGAYTVLADYSKADQETTTRLANRYASYALALDPASSQAFAVLGNSYNNFSDFEVAIVLYQRALTLDPNNSSALMWLGLVYLQQGRTDEAIGILERAVALDPQYRVALSNLVYLRIVTGDAESARRGIAQVREVDSSYDQIAGNVLVLGVLTADHALIVEGLREYARNKGGSSIAWIEEIVAALEGRGDVASAAARLRATGATTWVDPADPNPLFQSDSVLILELLGERALALDLLDDIIAGDPADGRWGLYGEHFGALRCEPRYRTQMRSLGYEAMVDSWDCP